MFKCHTCGHTAAKSEFVSEVFSLEPRRVLVEHIPAQVCKRCGEENFSRTVTEKVLQLVRGGKRPIRTEALDVFVLA
jgi:HTH-type transcriptional regulator / antitoxin MqsA